MPPRRSARRPGARVGAQSDMSPGRYTGPVIPWIISVISVISIIGYRLPARMDPGIHPTLPDQSPDPSGQLLGRDRRAHGQPPAWRRLAAVVASATLTSFLTPPGACTYPGARWI